MNDALLVLVVVLVGIVVNNTQASHKHTLLSSPSFIVLFFWRLPVHFRLFRYAMQYYGLQITCRFVLC